LLTFKGHDAPVTSCSFSPDGEEIVSGSIRNTNTYGGVLKTWDIKTGREILTFNLQSGDVLSCAFSPDGGKVVSCGSNRKITVWNAFTCEKIYSVPNPVKEIRFCSFSPDGKMIIAGGSGNNIRMWEADSGKEVSVFNGHTGPVSCGSFLPDSTHFVSGSHDGTLKLWNTGTRARRTYLNGPGYGNTALCDFSKDNSLSICMFKAKKHPCIICNAMSGKEIRTFRHRRRELRSFVREAKKRVLKLGSWSGFLKTQPYSPDGHSIVTKKDYRSSDADIIEKDTRKAVMTLSGHTGYVTACSWSPDGRKIVTGSEDNTLRIWDAGNGKEIKSLGRHHGLSVPYCNFSSDGKWIVAVSEYYENAVKIWDPATGEESASFILESGISTLSQSGCGRNIACGDEDGNYYLLRLTGFCFDNPVITLQRKPGTKRKWPGFAVARQNKEEIFSLCPVCGERTVGNELVVNKIEELNKKYGLVPGDSPCLKLPAGAWEDPGLISSCPGCWTVLKVNPFIAQGDD